MNRVVWKFTVPVTDRSTKEWHANTFDEAVAILARVTKAAS